MLVPYICKSNILNFLQFGEFNNWDVEEYPAVRNEYGVWDLTLPADADGTPKLKHGERVKIQVEYPDGTKVSLQWYNNFRSTKIPPGQNISSKTNQHSSTLCSGIQASPLSSHIQGLSKALMTQSAFTNVTSA